MGFCVWGPPAWWRAPLLIVLVTNLLNIILDWLLIVVFGLQSDGAATATVISDYSDLVLALVDTRRHVRKLSVLQLNAQKPGNYFAVQQLLLTSHGLDSFARATEALVGRAIGARRIEDFLTICKASTLWSIFVAVLFTFFRFM